MNENAILKGHFVEMAKMVIFTQKEKKRQNEPTPGQPGDDGRVEWQIVGQINYFIFINKSSIVGIGCHNILKSPCIEKWQISRQKW